MASNHKLRSMISYLLLVTAVVVIGVTGALSYTNIKTLIARAGDRATSYQALSALDAVLSRLDEVEAAETGTAFATQESYLTHYRTASQEIRQQSDAVSALIAGHPEQQAMLASLVVQRVAFSTQVIEAVQDGQPETADEILGSGRGGQLTAEIRKTIAGIKDAERALIARYDSSLSRQGKNALLTIAVGCLLSILAVLSYFLFIRNQIALRKKDRESLKKLLLTVEQSSDLVVVTDKAGTIEYVNRAVETVSGYTTAELLGKNRDIWKSGKHGEKFFAEMQNTVFAGLPFSGLAIYRAKNGKLFYLEETVTPFRDEKSITHLISTRWGSISRRAIRLSL